MDEYDFKFKHVLVRVDFNVPLNNQQNITDDMRITESLPTIQQIIDDGGIPIILSHLGRPKGKWVPTMSMEIVAKHLKDKFRYDVIFANDCFGEAAEKAKAKAKPGNIVLLENLRFYEEETKNDMEFAKKIAKLGDVYINDAFGTVHRYHSSIHALPSLFKEKFAGKSLLWELEYLKNAQEHAESPQVAVIGGAKISDKIDVIRKLIEQSDSVLIGGGMMFTFLKAMGKQIGRSIFESDKIDVAKQIMADAEKNNCKLLLPIDVVVADTFDRYADWEFVSVDDMPSDWLGMDIGPETRKLFSEEIMKARTVTWNGPMGVFEMERFAVGTRAIANALANVTAKGATTILGGGDSAAAVKQMNLINKVTHVTPGGGAWLKYMEGKELPGIAALEA